MEAAKRAAVDAPWTVSSLAERLDSAIRAGMPQKVRVVGEVSNFTDRTHWYFDLKDAAAVVNCVMFASAARKAAASFPDGRLGHGMQVVVTGRVEYYTKGGRISLIVERVEPVGEGALDAAYRKLCEELRALGYFAAERKRPLPAFPRKIAVVTSRTGAALQDVLNTIGRRCPAVGVLLADVRVQGDGAAAEVAAAIRTIGDRRDELGVDAILVTRGGGSKEDLWAFNDRNLAETIFRCPLPVVAAIGHETDTTIAELVADERCATPTQAAMRLTPDSGAVLRQAESLRRRLAALVTSRLAAESKRLTLLARHPVLSNPGRLVEAAAERLDATARRLDIGMLVQVERARHSIDRLAARLQTLRPTALHSQASSRVEVLRARLLRAVLVQRDRTRTRLGHLEQQLEAVSPVRVLARGYSITLDTQGRAVRSVNEAPPGTKLTTRLADGSVDSVVSGSSGSHPPLPPPPPRRTRSKPAASSQSAPDQMDLFGG